MNIRNTIIAIIKAHRMNGFCMDDAIIMDSRTHEKLNKEINKNPKDVIQSIHYKNQIFYSIKIRECFSKNGEIGFCMIENYYKNAKQSISWLLDNHKIRIYDINDFAV